MPVVLRHKGCRFLFFSNEGEPREPLHIHVQKGECIAKFWVEPEVQLSGSYGFSSSELKEFMEVIEENKYLIREKWNEHFNF